MLGAAAYIVTLFGKSPRLQYTFAERFRDEFLLVPGTAALRSAKDMWCGHGLCFSTLSLYGNSC